MNAVILAAEHGTDLNPLTSSRTPKHLLPIGNRPCVAHAIEALRDAGFSRVAISVNGTGDEYRRVIGDGSQLGVEVSYADEVAPLGTAGCLRAVRGEESGPPLLVVNGNLILSSEDIHSLLEAHRNSKAAVTVGVIPTRIPAGGRPQHDRLSIGPQGSVIDMRVDYLKHDHTPEFRAAGVYLFERSALARMPESGYYDLKEQFIPDLLKSGLPVRIHPLRSYLRELNSAEDYLRIHFDLCHGRTGMSDQGEELMEGVRVQGSVVLPPDVLLVGPMILGAGVRVGARCRLVGPLVIGKDVEIGDGVFLRESVVGDGVRIGRGARVQTSILAEGVEVPDKAQILDSVATQQGLSMGQVNLVERELRISSTVMPFNQFVGTGLKRNLYCGFKRMFDFVCAATASILLLPLMIAVAVAIRWDSRGPLLFKQRRCGKNGKEFTMLKFRSMRVDAEDVRKKIKHLNECDGPVFKINNDPRFTPVGQILRKYSLDELPQLWNVLRGDMSLVGPRPLAEAELRTCPSWREIRLLVKPGMTGLWQVSSREKVAFQDWIQHDLRYVREQSWSLDLSILLRTFSALASGF